MINKREYKPIFCDSLLERTTIEKCNYCNYPNLKPYLLTMEKNSLDCSNKCINNKNICKSYIYNKDKVCNLYNRLPYNIISKEDKCSYKVRDDECNSGYIKKYKEDYNTLSENNKNEIKLKCASQFLNKKFVANKKIDLKDCLKVFNNNNNNTEFYVDPQCLFDKYSVNKHNTEINDIDIYKDPNITNKTDTNIDVYNYNYNMYMNAKRETENKNYEDKVKNINQNVSSDHNYKKNYNNAMDNMFNPIIDSHNRIDKRLGIVEKFNAEQMRNVHRSFLIIILFSIFIFFIISFYTIKKK
jgi:hypothetical protein